MRGPRRRARASAWAANAAANASSCVGPDRQPRRRAMPAEALEMRRSRRRARACRSKRGDRAAGALPAPSPCAGDQHDRPAEALHEPRGDDPDHALVPVLAPDDVAAPAARSARATPRRRATASRRIRSSTACRSRFSVSSSSASRSASRGVLGEHELERDVGPAEPAGGIDPRREPEADGGRVDGGRIDVRRRASARAARASACARARAGPRSRARGSRRRAARRRRSSRARRDRGGVRAPGGRRRAAPARACGRRRCRRARGTGSRTAAWRRSGSRAAASPGRWWSVTITSRPSARARATSSTAVIPQSTVRTSADAVVGEPRDRVARDAVALLEAARQVPADVGAELAQRQHGERGRADAVDVVVAVDADPLAALRPRLGSARPRPPCRRAGAGRGRCPRASRNARAASGRRSPRRTSTRGRHLADAELAPERPHARPDAVRIVQLPAASTIDGYEAPRTARVRAGDGSRR